MYRARAACVGPAPSACSLNLFWHGVLTSHYPFVFRTGGAATMREARTGVKALKRTRFSKCDFVNGDAPAGRVHTVLCLSVTKWVHFNWGDEGVRALFRRAHSALHPGGLFVLEPQPWKSYRQVFKKPVRRPLLFAVRHAACATLDRMVTLGLAMTDK
jgi:Bicoid-interacting protein 3 (Bin3)